VQCAAALALLQLAAGALAAIALRDGAVTARLWLAPAALTMLLCRLLLAVQGMLLVEQLYRRTVPSGRWGIRHACLGLGTLFGYDFYLYSDALLFRQLDANLWAARGLVDALCAPLLLLSVARAAVWAPQLALSRQMLLRSVTVVGAAGYLLTMAGGAYYLRFFGGAWGAVMQVVWLGVAVVALVVALCSGTLRARLRVTLNKHFYRARFDYRAEWMRLTRTLADGGPAVAERTIEAVAQLVESPAGALWLRREAGQFEPAASWNMAPQRAVEPAGADLCRFLAQRHWVIDVPDCARAPQRYAGLALPAWLCALPAVWLIVPLTLHGRLAGFVVLTRPRAPCPLNWEVTDLLKIAASQAASYLAQREAAESLTVARQFESFNRLSAFIVHDLKNLVFQLSLLVSNAARHKADPAFQDDMLATLEHSVSKMTLLLQKLSGTGAPDPAAPVPLAAMLARAVAACAGAGPVPALDLPAADGAASALCVLADAGRLERVLGHMIQNAIDATARDGQVSVRLVREQQTAVVVLRDSGHGMSPQFIRERLFRPFESTKPAGMGIGAFESREYIGEIGGRLEVESEPAVGTTFRVILPLYQDSGCGAQPPPRAAATARAA
jgi:putative PEP-CTERM system histidine kinase